MPSLLTGKYVNIDYSDGSGMNLLDISSFKWNQHILDLIAPNLKEKLGEPWPADSFVACISSYWQIKYGFSSKCEIYTFSGKFIEINLENFKIKTKKF